MDTDFHQLVVANYGDEVAGIFHQLLRGVQSPDDGCPVQSPEELLLQALQMHREQCDRLLYEEEVRFFSYPE